MNLLYRVIYASKCTSTHHKLAMDALCNLRGNQARQWGNLFLKYWEVYLQGSKDPDKKFKDFRNHVLHVHQDYWGGAVAATEKWYAATVDALQERNWKQAVYCAGVMSHYYTDPIHPFHTAQSDEESRIHRAVEWSISRSFDDLQLLLEDRIGYPDFEVPEGQDWLATMVRQGAEASNAHYEALIKHYDFDKAIQRPESGLDKEGRERVARLIGHASIGLTRILEAAFKESEVEPPDTSVSVYGVLAAMTVPIFWVTRKLVHASDRRQVQAIYGELKATGTVMRTLPEDDRAIKRMHDEAFAKMRAADQDPAPSSPESVAAPAAPSSPAIRPDDASASPTYFLSRSSDIVDAPSIGPKTARRLSEVGVHTVDDLLEADPQVVAEKLAVRYIDAQTLREWQLQAALVCQIPKLRGHDAQILVACGLKTPAQVASAQCEELVASVDQFIRTSDGQHVVRTGAAPDNEEVADWIESATQARPLRAA